MRPTCTILMLSVLLVVVPSTLAQESAETLPINGLILPSFQHELT